MAWMQPVVMKTDHVMALNFYPIFIPVNHLIGGILDL
jgi:hypothetical protein